VATARSGAWGREPAWILTVGKAQFTLTGVSWRDVRLGQIVTLTFFTLLGQTVLHFSVSPIQVVASLLVSIVVDEALTYGRERRLLLPASATITGLWPFALASLIGIATKHFCRTRQRHVFNPSNIGVVAALALVPGAHNDPNQWGPWYVTAFLLVNLGLFIVYRVRRFDLAAAFLIPFALLSLLATEQSRGDLGWWWATTFRGDYVLFTFFMLTDPRSTPATVPARVAFGALVAFLTILLTALGQSEAPFQALALASVVGVWLDALWPAKADRAEQSETGGPVSP
jgi:hypothetical protein